MGSFGWFAIVLFGMSIVGTVFYFIRRMSLAKTAKEITPLFESALRDLNNHTEYLSSSLFLEWKARQSAAIKALERYDPKMAAVLPDGEGAKFNSLYLEFSAATRDTKDFNQRFIEKRLEEDRARFDKVEAHPLTERQREAIVTEEDTTIVVAGAGTGKTSVIVGKVDYLLRHQLAKPDQMLVMAYNTAAAEELRQRMNRLGVSKEITVKTFHSFGNAVIGEANGGKQMVSTLATDARARKSFFRDTLQVLMSSPDYKKHVELLFTDQIDEEEESESLEQATSKATKIALMKAKSHFCLAGIRLSSRQEVKIANWLTLNGIPWEYERPYEIDLSTPSHRPYQPDFYLPKHEIYLEHFGIERDGSTASAVDSKQYGDEIKWKRSIHAKYDTILIETFSYDDTEGQLTRRLSERLAKHGVIPKQLSKDELDGLITESNREFGKFFDVLGQFLNLYRGSVKSWAEVEAAARSDRDKTFLKVMGEVVKSYEAHLRDEGKIDFDDMINQARTAIQKGEVNLPFTHIIIDEFQDITHNRFGLVQDIRSRVKNGRVFAVGDDWQSIYRFNGSDVSITTKLPDFAGVVARVDLDQTFRYPQKLLDATAKFVTKNPNQLKKKLHSRVSTKRPKPIIVKTTDGDEANGSALRAALAEIRKSQPVGQELSVFILARYNNSIPPNLVQLQREFAQHRISIQAMTAHKSKGLEADFVIILDLTAGGFPSGVSDDPVMHMVLSAGDEFAFAEERRLFYVAMTRAKQGTYLIAPSERASIFLEEDILSEEFSPWVEIHGALPQRHTCPKCGGKTIRKKNGKYGDFWACSNYPFCDGKLLTCGQCNQGAMVPNVTCSQCDNCHAVQRRCPRCGNGTLVERNGRYGPFLACSNWNGGRGCEFTQNIQSDVAKTFERTALSR